MGSVDRVDDQTFKVNFSGDGVSKLRERVRDKLKEFMGDYTDDTLVEYVIVLLRNGRCKEEAKSELNVFLGDGSGSFVSWLWDHLTLNLDLYIHPKEAYTDETAKTKSMRADQTGRNESHHMDSESEKGTDNLSRGRHKREWKGLGRDANEPPPLRSSEIDNICAEETIHRPQPPKQKKRSRHDEQRHMKREAVSQATIDAPRRLLQFAVRDAVATLKPSGLDRLVEEPSLKRIRSVLRTPSEDPLLVDRPRRIRSLARVPNPMATVIKAVQEAAEDVIRVKPAGSVFDRLGRGADVSESTKQVAEFRAAAVENEEYEEFDEMQEQKHSNLLQRSDYSVGVRNARMMKGETGFAFDSIFDNEGYDDINAMGHGVIDASQTVTSRGKSADGMRMSQNSEHDQPVPAANTSHKINISVNVNTWKSSHYQQSMGRSEIDGRKSIQDYEADAGKSGVHLMKENGNPVAVGNGNAKPAAVMQEVTRKILSSVSGGPYTAGRPFEDPDSRTIFVSNVHFAATKDNVSRHFNKFGEVLKVVIVTDAATGQPKGSAYVEFMRKEAADNALSLDGTSFMSRILKIVKRSSAPQEAPPIMTWPRIVRGSPYGATMFARARFARGISGAFRPRLPMKPGARSLQWKRDAQALAESGAATAARSLTYVRTDSKPDGNSGAS